MALLRGKADFEYIFMKFLAGSVDADPKELIALRGAERCTPLSDSFLPSTCCYLTRIANSFYRANCNLNCVAYHFYEPHIQ